ncbi:MAG: hypothetical protein FGM18_06955 [Burkholderiaceae bacterium]|nr:hypothetical protein [Burkholderiaceae bacterium]
MKSLLKASLLFISTQFLPGCTAVVIAADVAITGASAVVGAATSVVGGAVDLLTPDGDEKKK